MVGLRHAVPWCAYHVHPSWGSTFSVERAYSCSCCVVTHTHMGPEENGVDTMCGAKVEKLRRLLYAKKASLCENKVFQCLKSTTRRPNLLIGKVHDLVCGTVAWVPTVEGWTSGGDIGRSCPSSCNFK